MQLVTMVFQRDNLWIWKVIDYELPRWYEPLMSGTAGSYEMAAKCAKAAHDQLCDTHKNKPDDSHSNHQ